MPIAFARVVQADRSVNDAGSSLTIAATINGGDTVLASVAEVNAQGTVSSVTDSGGSSYSKLASVTPDREVELWGSVSALASTAITINFSTAVSAAVTVPIYTGVNAFGNTATNSALNSTVATVSLSIQDPNGWIVAGWVGVVAQTPTVTNGTARGTLYFKNAQGSVMTSLIDNTAASTQSLTCSMALASADNWGAAAVVLRPPAAAGSVVTPRLLSLLGVGT